MERKQRKKKKSRNWEGKMTLRNIRKENNENVESDSGNLEWVEA